MEQASKASAQIRGVGRPPKPKEPSREQVLALRIWEGQSIDVAVIERVRRIACALKDKGMSLDITLPHEDAGRYLDAHR